MSVSISEIIAGASVHAVPLAGECAGYLVLAAADQAVSAPRRIGPKEVHLEGDGSVRVDGARAAAEADSEADLRSLLDALLVSASSATPALLRASRRAPGRGIAALVHEIETALIPVNRAAAHRALARLERETERARHAGRLDGVTPPEPLRRKPEPPIPVENLVLEPSSVPVVEAPPLTEDEIPSLFAPPVEAIAAYAAEIETRPEPIVVRRSTRPPPPPARTPSPPPLPVRSSPPPLPVAEAQPTTPVFGTFLQSHSDDEMDIEVVFDDDLMDDELTGVLVRSAPLELSAMLETTAFPEPTEPSPLVLDHEPFDALSAEAPVTESADVESANQLAEAVAAAEPPESLRVEAVVDDALPALPPVVAAEPLPLEPSPVELLLEAPPVEPFAVEFAFAAPSARPPAVEVILETPPFDALFERHGETVPLALVVAPAVAELPPEPRLPMPKPRPSDVEALLDRMAQTEGEGNDELRSSLKGLAGLEPTPPPPLPES
jgi:hypothetical protein